MTAPRADIPVQLDVTTDGSGNYTSDWFDSAGAKSIYFMFGPNFGGSEAVTVEGSFDGTNALAQSGLSIYQTAEPTAIPYPFYRIKLTGGTASHEWWIAGRVVA